MQIHKISTVDETIGPKLASSPFFVGIAEVDQKRILGAAEYKKIPPKTTIIHGGAKATHLFLLDFGGVKYCKVTKQGQELFLSWLVPGDVFGLATLLRHPIGYMGTAESRERCGVYMWEHAELQKLSVHYPHLAENALRITLHYLAAYSERHDRLLTKTAEERLATTLIHLGHKAGQHHPPGIRVNITNEQLGNLADVGLFTATRVLSSWQRKGAITKERGRIIIQAPERLLAN